MSDFIDPANTICGNVSSSAAALPTPNTSTGSLSSPEASDLPAIATYFPTVLNVLQSLNSRLHALGTTPSMQVLWARALAAYETLLSDAEAAQTAAQSGDLTAYDAAASTESTDNGRRTRTSTNSAQPCAQAATRRLPLRRQAPVRPDQQPPRRAAASPTESARADVARHLRTGTSDSTRVMAVQQTCQRPRLTALVASWRA
jgi:hypothetical protein